MIIMGVAPTAYAAPARASAIRSLLVSVETKTVSPGLTPPHSMHFKAPRIIWMGLEDPGV